MLTLLMQHTHIHTHANPNNASQLNKAVQPHRNGLYRVVIASLIDTGMKLVFPNPFFISKENGTRVHSPTFLYKENGSRVYARLFPVLEHRNASTVLLYVVRIRFLNQSIEACLPKIRGTTDLALFFSFSSLLTSYPLRLSSTLTLGRPIAKGPGLYIVM